MARNKNRFTPLDQPFNTADLQRQRRRAALTCLSPCSARERVKGSEVQTDLGPRYIGSKFRFDTHLMRALRFKQGLPPRQQSRTGITRL